METLIVLVSLAYASSYLAGMIDTALLLFYHLRMPTGRMYLKFFEQMDTKAHFKLLQIHDESIKSYSDYLKRHEEAVKDGLQLGFVYEQNLRSNFKFAFFKLLLLVVPAFFFAENWLYWVVPALIFIAITFFDYRFRRKQDKIYYHSAMQAVVMDEWHYKREKFERRTGKKYQ